MSKSVKDFLLGNPVDQIEQSIVLSERLKDFPFKVRPFTSAEYNAYVDQSTKIVAGGKRKQASAKFDGKSFNMAIILNHTVEPNFRDADFISKAGVNTPEDLVNKFLLAGEVTDLVDAISELSGFKEFEQEVEEVKND